MNQDDFKKLLDESLKPIQTGLNEVRQDVSTLKEDVSTLKEDVSTLKEDVLKVKEDLQEVKDTQESHTEMLEKRILPPLIYVETTVKGYADAYKTNKANIERMDDRVTKLEDTAGIIPPPELAIQR